MGSIKIWDASDWTNKTLTATEKALLSPVTFSPDGKILASGYNMWVVETGEHHFDLVKNVYNKVQQTWQNYATSVAFSWASGSTTTSGFGFQLASGVSVATSNSTGYIVVTVN